MAENKSTVNEMAQSSAEVKKNRTQYKAGEMINIRNLDIGMTVIFPKIVDGQIQVDKNNRPIPDTDIWISKTDEAIDKAWQIHLVGTKAEYIFTHLDSPESPMDGKDSYLMETVLPTKDKPGYGIFNNEDGDVCVRPRFVSFQVQDGYTVLWITNDNKQHDEFTDQYIMVIKQFEQ